MLTFLFLRFSKRHFFTAAALISITLLPGCNSGSGKAVAPQFTADPAAIEYAVKKTIEMQLFVNACSQVNDELKSKALSAQTAWLGRNWPQAEAADRYYSGSLEQEALVYNGEKIALTAVSFYAEIESNVKLKLDQSRHSHQNIADTCINKISMIQSGDHDLTQNKNAELYLTSLVSATPGEIYKVPRLAGNLKLSTTPGRSQYNLEKTLTECKNARIITLRNEWPHESYGAFCADGKSIFVSCEWGECSTQN